MKPYAAVLALLKATTAVTAIVGRRVYHAYVPKSATMDNIAFFEIGLPRRFTGIESQDYQIGCRGTTLARTMDLARVVVDLFHGTSSTGIYGTQGTFSIGRAFQSAPVPLIPEPRGSMYNAPVQITMVYPSSTVS
jgi:hypothetical protein